MYKTLFCGLFFACFGRIFGQSTEIPKLLIYKDSTYAIQYPATWRMNLSGALGTSFVLIAPMDSSRMLSLVSLNSQPEQGEAISLDSVLVLNKLQMPTAIEAFELLGDTVVHAKRFNYFQISFSGKQNTRELKWLQRGFLWEHQYYTLTYTATPENFDRHLSDVKTIMDSFRFNSSDDN